MARILLASAGYWGDVAALVPLAEELTRRGHDTTLLAPRSVSASLRGGGFAVRSEGTDVSTEDYVRDQPGWLQRSGVLSSSLSVPLTIRRGIVDPLADLREEVQPLADTADVVVVHPGALAARLAAEVAGVPWACLHPFPMYVPTAERYPAGLPVASPGAVRRAWNRLGWWGYGMGTAIVSADRPINRLRRRLGLAPVRANLTLGSLTGDATIIPVSPRYLPRSADWPRSHHLTGFMSWTGDGELPDDLAGHLADGPPPVCVTLGSSAANHSHELFGLFATAADELGLRAVLLVGSEDNRTGVLADRDDVWTFAPLDRVLARCRAVVHSGSLGTNAATLQAGLPSLVAPDLVDQGWHARRVAQLGAGVLLQRRRRSPATARGLLEQLVHDRGHAAAARELGEQLAAEDGPAAAANVVESLAASGRSAGAASSSSSAASRRPPRSGGGPAACAWR